MKRLLKAAMVLAMVAGVWTAVPASAEAAATAKRVQVSGEIIDSWCYTTEIMYAQGSAHYQCAVWCAVGGIPVSIKGDDGKVYVILRLENDGASNAGEGNKIVKIQGHQVTVDGDLYERDGVRYLFINKVADDKGIVNLTHAEYGIQPFGK